MGDDNGNVAAPHQQQQEGPPPKRQRRADGDVGTVDDDSLALVVQQQDQEQQQLRTSSLSSPTLQLSGHKASVYALRYSPRGSTLISCSFDTTCLLWNAASGQYENYNVLKGHKNAVLDCCWLSDNSSNHTDSYLGGGGDEEGIGGGEEQEDTSLRIVTCGADKTVQLWDAWTGQRIRKWVEHAGVVNSVSAMTSYGSGAGSTNTNKVVSVGDDGCGYVWDVRQKRPAMSFGGDGSDDAFPILAVAATDSQIYTGGIDNMIHCWDAKNMSASNGNKNKDSTLRKLYSMKGHTDSITSLSIHPRGTHILSNSMDQTLRSWDIQPFVGNDQKTRHCKTFVGHTHNAERGVLKCGWNGDGTMVSCGSADKLVHIWDEFSTEELYLLPGHKGCVNCVAFHPRENVVASGSSDKRIFVGELS